MTEQRQRQQIAAQHRERVEAEAVARDQAFRANLPRGIPAGHVPDGVTAGALMMLSDPMDQGRRRVSVLEHALAHEDNAVYHPIDGDVVTPNRLAPSGTGRWRRPRPRAPTSSMRHRRHARPVSPSSTGPGPPWPRDDPEAEGGHRGGVRRRPQPDA